MDAAGDSANGVIYPFPFDETSQNIVQKEFRQKFLSTCGVTAEVFAANSYDALMVLSNCFKKAGIDSVKVKGCLYGTQNYNGVSGTLSFDQNGDVEKPFIVKTVKDGKFVKLEQK